MRLAFLSLQFLLFLPVATTALQPSSSNSHDAAASRRNVLSTLIAGAGGALSISTVGLESPHPANAATVAASGIASGSIITATVAASTIPTTNTNRDQLLEAITKKASDDQIFNIINNLKDPSNGKAATLPDRLEGEWELIWSFGAEGFSPLLQLPKPLRPDSYQYFGAAAASEVGEGRIAQGLTGGILGSNQFWLSSGAVPFAPDPSVLEIQPPFRFQVGGRYGTGKPKKTFVEAGNDADFRKVNARTEEAQKAEKNQYQQLYLEDVGRGSLRVSSVIAGDPVIVGAIFVHQKL